MAPVKHALRATRSSGDRKISPASNGLKYTKEKTPLPRKNVGIFNPSLAKKAIRTDSWPIAWQLRGGGQTLRPSRAKKWKTAHDPPPAIQKGRGIGPSQCIRRMQHGGHGCIARFSNTALASTAVLPQCKIPKRRPYQQPAVIFLRRTRRLCGRTRRRLWRSIRRPLWLRIRA